MHQTSTHFDRTPWFDSMSARTEMLCMELASSARYVDSRTPELGPVQICNSILKLVQQKILIGLQNRTVLSIDSWRHNLNFSLDCFMLGELQWMFTILYNVSWSGYSGRIHKLCYLGMVFLKVLKLTSCLVKRNGHINNRSNYACHLIPILRVTLRFKLLHVETAHFSTNCFKRKYGFQPEETHTFGYICTEKLDYTLYSDFTIARWSISLVFNRESLELVEIFADNLEFVHFKSWFSQHRTIYKVKINSDW